MSSNTIELNTKQGVRLIKHTDQTVFLKPESGRIKPVDLNAINSGDPIAVTGDFNPTSRTFTAEIVVVLEQE